MPTKESISAPKISGNVLLKRRAWEANFVGGNSDFKNLETLSLHILSNTSFEDCGKVVLSSDFFNLVLKVFLCQKSYILTYLQLPIIFEISFVKAVCVDGLLAPHPIYHPIPFTHFQPPWCYIRLRRCYFTKSRSWSRMERVVANEREWEREWAGWRK